MSEYVLAGADSSGLEARASAAADEAVEQHAGLLAAAFESGSVAEIEKAFYQVFRQVYLRGFHDGASEGQGKGPSQPT